MWTREYRIQFGVGEDRDGQPIGTDERRDMVAAICGRAASTFGGWTLYDHKGGWIDDKGRAVIEPGHTLSLVISNTRDNTAEDRAKAFAGVVCRAARQQCVMLIWPSGTARIINA